MADQGFLPIADSHNDLLLACQHRRERGVRDPFGDDWLPGLRSGGVVFQVLPIFTEEQFIGEGALRRTLEIISLAREIAEVHSSDVAIVETPAEIQETIDSGRIALLLAIEGAEPVGASLSMFETLWRLGIRMASLTWNRRTLLADGVGEADTNGRLTTLGIEAVAEMERLGMVIDISHLSMPGVQHLSELATKPFVASHSSCRALVDHPRNLTNSQIEAVAESGGFVAANAFGAFVSSGEPTLGDYVDHLEHLVSVAGPERVGIGADFIEDLVQQVDPILGRNLLVDPSDLSFINNFKATKDYPHLATVLADRFGPDLARSVACDNMVTFFCSVLPNQKP
ncbi:MAG: membrane dipeptidase [Acidimicrobiia bacterium]|nr:membrane dipeptidase [Acidimicrobiia bacterium]